MKNLEVLALIPARGGSKSMPRKNLRKIAGKPMVVHSIEHALEAGLVSRVILTTDDEEIAQIGREAGAEVPFLRPVRYAQDRSTDYEFVRHALEWLRDNEGYEVEMVVQLRPTTPVRDVRLIDRAITLFAENSSADSLRAVVPAHFTPYKMWELVDDGYLKPLIQLSGVSESYNQPRQLLPAAYQQDGFLDIVRPQTIFEQESITGSNILPFFLDEESIDIDYENELIKADRIMRGE